jgi:hypothetical protein
MIGCAAGEAGVETFLGFNTHNSTTSRRLSARRDDRRPTAKTTSWRCGACARSRARSWRSCGDGRAARWSREALTRRIIDVVYGERRVAA